MKNNTKVIIGILVVLVVVVGIWFTVGQRPPIEDPVAEDPVAEDPVAEDPVAEVELAGEITHWVWGDYEERGAVDFPLYFPNIKVNYVFVPADEYTTKLMSTIASGAEMPDVVNLEMTPRGMLVNMDVWERLDAEPYNLDKSLLVPFSIPLISNERGEIVSVQIDNTVGGYAFDRALAKEFFGTDDPTELENIFPSLNEIVSRGKEVSQKSNGEIFMFSGVGDAFSAISGLFTSEPLVLDGKLNLEPTFLETYEIIAELIANRSIGPYTQWTPAWNASFTSERVIFYAAPSWFMTFVIEPNDRESVGRWGLMTPPGGGFSWGGTAYAIPKNARQENKMLAWTYIEWFTMSMEGTRSFVREHATPTLFLPAIGTDIYAPNPDPFYGGQDIMSKLLDISDHPNTRTRPMTRYDQAIMDANEIILHELAQGLSAEDAMEKLRAEIISRVPELAD